jgi:hypothetical protein
VREVCYKARELLIEEGNVVGVDAPVTVSLPLQREKKASLIGNHADMRRHPWPVPRSYGVVPRWR